MPKKEIFFFVGNDRIVALKFKFFGSNSFSNIALAMPSFMPKHLRLGMPKMGIMGRIFHLTTWGEADLPPL